MNKLKNFENEEIIDARGYFKEAFLKLYEENKREDIELEQFTNNISTMLEIAKALESDFVLNEFFI